MKKIDVICIGPVGAEARVLERHLSSYELLVVCKVTYSLKPRACVVATEVEPIHARDLVGAASPSIRAPSDLAPEKPFADVVIVGHAFAPGGAPQSRVAARLLMADVDKTIDVWCDRFVDKTGAIEEGPHMSRLALGWERASGGADTQNPLGIGPDARDARGRRPLPNLMPANFVVDSPSVLIPPVGFGPIPARFPSRRARLGPRAAMIPQEAVDAGMLPDGASPHYYNVAPMDQQIATLRPDEWFRLENLLVDRPELITKLPGVRPRAFLEGTTEVPLTFDTLWIDTDRGICTVTCRGRLPLPAGEAPIRLLVSLEQPGSSVAWAGKAPAAASTMALDEDDLEDEADVDSLAMTHANAKQPAPAASPVTQTLDIPGAAEPRQALPFAVETAPIMPSPVVMAIPVPAAIPTPAPIPAPELFVPPPATPMSSVAVVSAAAASNAAALGSSTPEAETPRPSAPAQRELRRAARAEIVELVYYSQKILPRIRKKANWRALLDALEEQAPDPEIDDPALAGDPAEAEEKRQIFEVLTAGEPLDNRSLEEAMDAGIRDDGRFVPPLVLVAGELMMHFDERARLGAMLASISALTVMDEPLEAAMSAGRKLLEQQDAAASSNLIQGLLGRLRDAHQRVKRPLPITHIEADVERALLEEKRYEKRKVLGAEHLLGKLHPAGTSVYLPLALADLLPSVERFRVRILAEAHRAVDGRDASPIALRVVALARVHAPLSRR